jgi:hypothetical protein
MRREAPNRFCLSYAPAVSHDAGFVGNGDIGGAIRLGYDSSRIERGAAGRNCCSVSNTATTPEPMCKLCRWDGHTATLSIRSTSLFGDVLGRRIPALLRGPRSPQINVTRFKTNNSKTGASAWKSLFVLLEELWIGQIK